MSAGLNSPALRTAGAVVAYIVLGAALCMLEFVAPRVAPMGALPYLGGVALAVAGGCVLALVFAPSRGAVGVFVAFMTASHMHNSPFVLPAGGVEWHPRELVLLLFLAHLAVRFAQGRASFPVSPLHVMFGLFGLGWLVMALGGLLAGNSMTHWIQEARYPIFLTVYIALIVCVSSPADLWRVVWLIAGITVLIALSSIALFAYTYATGNLITNVQNYLGEFVRRQVGPFLLQSARPNGHQYFEVGTAILVALLFCREISARARLIIVAVLALFAAAIAITMMRTAFVATGLSLALLAFASLPRPARTPVFLGLLSVVLFGGVAFGAVLSHSIEQMIPALGVSLRARVEEIAGGLTVFQAHPLLGGGLGSTFEAMGYVAKETRASYGQATYLMVHNVWLYYLFKGGLLTFTLALLGLGGTGIYGWRLADRLEAPVHRAFCRGLACAFLAQCVGSLAMPRFNYPTGIVFIALTATAFAVLARSAPLRPVAPGDHHV